MTATFEPADAPRLPAFLARELPFERRAARVDGHLVHWIDEGGGPPVLLMHGNPTWSYLWRKVVPRLAAGGLRAVVPDLVGLGLSDKPRSPSWHRLDRHVDLVDGLVHGLGLEDLVLVGQDWGGPIAAGVGARAPERVHGVVWANTAVLPPARPFRSKAFPRFSHVPAVSDLAFRALGFPLPVLDRVQGDRSSIGWREKAAYLWPLRNPLDRAAPLGLARMIADAEEHPSTAVMDGIGAWAESWEGPAALVWGSRDPILGRTLGRHRRALPQARVTETQAGHFLQEEVPGALAEAILGVGGR